MRKLVIFMVLYCALTFKFQAQSSGEQFFQQAQAAIDSNNHKAAEELFLKAELAFKKDKNWIKLHSTYYELARTQMDYGEFVSALKSSDEGISVVKKHLPGRDTLLSEHYINIAFVLDVTDKSQQALDTLMAVQDIQNRFYPSFHIQRVYFQRALGSVLSSLQKHGEAIEQYKKGLSILKKMGKSIDMESAYLHNNIGFAYGQLYDQTNKKKHYLIALDLKRQLLSPDHTSLATAYGNIANVYIHTGHYRKAKMFLEESLKIIIKKHGRKSFEAGRCYLNLGYCANVIGDRYRAKNYYVKALEIISKKMGADHPYTIYCYNNLGKVLHELKDYEKSLEYYEFALEAQLSKTGKLNSRVSLLLRNMAAVQQSLDRLEQAEWSFLEALKIEKTRLGDRHIDIMNLYNLVCSFYSTTDNRGKALEFCLKSLDLAKYHPEKSRNRALAYFNYADLINNESIDSALLFIQRSVSQITNNFNPVSLEDNPEVEDISGHLFNTFILTKKADFLAKKYDQDQTDIKLLEAALKTYNLCEDFLQRLRLELTYENSKLDFGKYLYPVYEGQINCYYSLFQQTKDPTYVEKAFAISTFSKSVHLMELVKASSINSFAGVPDSVILKREELIGEINYCKEKIVQSQLSNDSLQIAKLEQIQFLKNREYEKYNSLIQTDYPEYFKMLHSWESPGIELVRNQLTNNNTAVLEFFVSKKATYVFLLADDQLTFERIKEDITTPVLEFRKSVTDFKFISQQPDEANQMLVNQGHLLYKLLLEKIFAKLSPKISNIILIPDGILGHLPFSLLLDDKANANGNYIDLPYLLKKYSISYGFSSELLLEKQANKDLQEKTFAGFAPTYPGKLNVDDEMIASLSRDGEHLMDLPNASREVSTISSILKGDHWIGEHASEAIFKKMAPTYSILHLSMHGILDDENPAFSKLIFTNVPDSTEDNQLHAIELYGMKLNASLAVISACNSGLGKINEGEGIMSLSRAFAYAGVPATIMSLWSVPDKSTADLMISFYKKINTNSKKDHALREAKLEYLSTNKDPLFSHPYFWGGFVPIGDMAPINAPSTLLSVLSLVFFGLLIVVAIVVLKRRAEQQNA